MIIYWPHLMQVALLAVGILGMALLVNADSTPKRLWAYGVLLFGQPFWIGVTLGAEQWGMLVMSIIYTGLYAQGVVKALRGQPL